VRNASVSAFTGHGPRLRCRGISPGQELVDAALGEVVDDAGDDVGEVAVRLDVEA
jgi:hypothetical protein